MEKELGKTLRRLRKGKKVSISSLADEHYPSHKSQGLREESQKLLVVVCLIF